MAEDVLLRGPDDQGVLILTFDRPERNTGWTTELDSDRQRKTGQ